MYGGFVLAAAVDGDFVVAAAAYDGTVPAAVSGFAAAIAGAVAFTNSAVSVAFTATCVDATRFAAAGVALVCSECACCSC